VAAVTVPVGGGRVMRLRGYIDRVDLDEVGRARVIDYKTGRYSRTAIGVENQLDSGRRLQLPIYGRAVRDRSRARGLPAPAVTSLYWYATVRGEFRQTPLEVDDRVEEVLTEVLSHIDAGVRAGCFPQVPGDYQEWWGRCQNCSFCDYDSLCPAGRDVLAAAKAESPALAPHRALRPAMADDRA
jgi:RecB family exonuclease